MSYRLVQRHEAVPTIQRMKDHSCNGMTASAGNTARAFTHYCGEDNFSLTVVADIHAHRIWVQKE